MPRKKEVSKIILQMLIYTGLLVCFIYFFMKDQMDTFLKGRTTITRRVENVKTVEFPTITICLDPATKLSVAKKYGFKSHNHKFSKEVPNKTLPEVFDEITYGLNRDFSIINFGKEKSKIKLGFNDVYGYWWTKMPFFVEAIKTYNYGTCIKLEPRFEMENLYPIRLSIELSSTIENEDKIDSVIFLFTSNKSWVNIAENNWPQYQPLKVKVNMIQEYTHLKLQPVEEYFNEGKENTTECVKNLIESQNCSNPCTILTLPGIPYCQTVKDLKCGRNQVWHTQEYKSCYTTQKATYYNLNEQIENPYHEDKTTLKTDVYIIIHAMKKIIKEEVYVLTFQDLIGSVGGSLGLFFGLSFSGILFPCLNKFYMK